MKKSIAIVLSVLLYTVAFSQGNFDPENILKQKPPQRLVNDYTQTLTIDQEEVLENKLVAFYDSTSTQVAVVIIPTLKGNEIADYNLKLFRAWGVGSKEHNNGILLLISKEDRQLNITTGYGVEGPLPDITSKEIIDEIIVPQFKGDDYYRGIDEGTTAIIKAVRGAYSSPVAPTTSHQYPLLVRILFWIIGIIIVLFLIKMGWFWPLLRIATSIVFSGGGSRSGGGGFGGFGGGSSGGGGASGSW